MAREFTTWENLKAILSDKCLKFALDLLPDDSPEWRELASFLVGYLKRSLARREGL